MLIILSNFFINKVEVGVNLHKPAFYKYQRQKKKKRKEFSKIMNFTVSVTKQGEPGAPGEEGLQGKDGLKVNYISRLCMK